MEAAGKLLTLAIPDLQHVQMRHAPPNSCAARNRLLHVIVDYARTPSAAAEGIVRGMDFSPPLLSPAAAP